MRNWPKITVAFITYDRFDLLEQSYTALRRNCSYPNMEWIVCDDGSPRAVQERIRLLRFDRYCLAERNVGLGANQNAAVANCQSEWLLAIQDDWSAEGPADFLQEAAVLLEERPDVMFVRFWRHPPIAKLPAEKHVTSTGRVARIYRTKGALYNDEHLRLYSDRPHLRRKQLHNRIGLYNEDLRWNAMEQDFARRFEADPDIRVAIIEGYEDVFVHIGTEQSYNPSQRRENLRQWLNHHPVLKYPWRTYVWLRYGRSGGV
jgi:glycosyltransferase involved in cell wall biosynthesis